MGLNLKFNLNNWSPPLGPGVQRQGSEKTALFGLVGPFIWVASSRSLERVTIQNHPYGGIMHIAAEGPGSGTKASKQVWMPALLL